MLHNSTQKCRKVLRNIIIVTLSFVIISFAATKIVYDNIFVRYDNEILVSSFPEAIKATVSGGEEYEFSNGENSLKGSLLKAHNGDTLIVMVPGYRAEYNEYLYVAQSFIDSGFSVFLFDTTGHGESGGESSVGFSQVVIDLNSAIQFINENKNFGFKNIVLFGHSRGGYAACVALKDNKNISAVISVAGLNSAMEAVVAPAKNYVGPLVYVGYPFLWSYQSMLFGSDITSRTAAECIENTNVPVFIAHGTKDSVVPIDDNAIMAYKDEIKRENVTYYLSDKTGENGHTDILFGKNNKVNDNLMREILNFLSKV